MQLKDIQVGGIYVGGRSHYSMSVVKVISTANRGAKLSAGFGSPVVFEPMSKKGYGVRSFGIPVVRIVGHDRLAAQAEKLAQIDVSKVAIVHGVQTVNDIEFAVELWPSRHFATDYETFALQEAQREAARIERERIKGERAAAAAGAGVMVATILQDTGIDPKHIRVNTDNGKVTFDVQELLDALTKLVNCSSCGKPVGNVCWQCA